MPTLRSNVRNSPIPSYASKSWSRYEILDCSLPSLVLILIGRGGACLVLLAFPLVLILAFSSFPKSTTSNDQSLENSPRQISESSEKSEKSADLPHVPLVQHNHPKDLSLSEKAAVAVAGLVGPGAPTSVFDFRATTIGKDEIDVFDYLDV